MFRLDSIKKKIFVRVFMVVLIGFTTIGISSFIYMSNIHDNMTKGNTALGKTASRDSSKALGEKAKEQLMDVADAIARLTDGELKTIQNQTEMVASEAESIYSNPQQYSGIRSDVDYLKEEQVGQFALHIKTAEGVTKESIQGELNLISNISKLLSQVNNVDLNINASYIGSPSGFQLSADRDPQGPNNRAFPVTERKWYTGAVEKEGIYWTDVFVDTSAKRTSINCSKPYYTTDKNGVKSLAGVAVSAATLDQVKDLISTSGVGETGYSFIVDGGGNIVITPKEMNIQDGVVVYQNLLSDEDKDIQKIAEKMIAGESGISRATLNGKDVFIAYNPLTVMPWSMVTVIETSEVQKPSEDIKVKIHGVTQQSIQKMNDDFNKTIVIFAILLVVIILVTIILSLQFAGKITKPINGLTKNVEAISAGNLDVVIEPVNTGDEIEALANSFGMMTVDLKAHIANIQSITAEKERIGAELQVATQIQASMLPCIFPAFPERSEIDVYALMEPAKEVGGDFYDFFLIDDNHLAIVIADVSGKGVPAALFMVITKTLIKNHAQIGESPEEVFTNVNTQLCENNEAEMFVTGWMGILEIDSGQFCYVNAGHNPPFLKRNSGTFEYLKSRAGFVLAGMEGMKYHEAEMLLNEGDVLYLYTDGITEAMDGDFNLYGDARLQLVLNEHAGEPLKQLLGNVKKDVDTFAKGEPQFDDMTMLALTLNVRE